MIKKVIGSINCSPWWGWKLNLSVILRGRKGNISIAFQHDETDTDMLVDFYKVNIYSE